MHYNSSTASTDLDQAHLLINISFQLLPEIPHQSLSLLQTRYTTATSRKIFSYHQMIAVIEQNRMMCMMPSLPLTQTRPKELIISALRSGNQEHQSHAILSTICLLNVQPTVLFPLNGRSTLSHLFSNLVIAHLLITIDLSISLLCIALKVLEKLVYDKTLPFLLQQLTMSQFGFVHSKYTSGPEGEPRSALPPRTLVQPPFGLLKQYGLSHNRLKIIQCFYKKGHITEDYLFIYALCIFKLCTV